MIKTYKQICACGREIRFHTFTGKYTMEQKELLVEQKDFNTMDLIMFFSEQIRNNERLYLKELTEVEYFDLVTSKFEKKTVEVISILDYNKNHNAYQNIKDPNQMVSKEVLIAIARGFFKEKELNLVHFIGKKE